MTDEVTRPPKLFSDQWFSQGERTKQNLMPFNQTVKVSPIVIQHGSHHCGHLGKFVANTWPVLLKQDLHPGMQIFRCKGCTVSSCCVFIVERQFAYPLVHPLFFHPLPVIFASVPVKQQPKEAEEPRHLQHIFLLLPQLQCGLSSHQHQRQLPASTS